MSNEETIPDTPKISKLKFRLKKLKRGDIYIQMFQYNRL